MGYAEFLSRKLSHATQSGMKPNTMPAFMRPDQKIITAFALERGKAAGFANCGLGKTIDELEWCHQIANKHGKTLILAPLCVGIQTAQIAKQFGYEVNLCKSQADVRDGINIANYERLDAFYPDEFAGICLDESSILKNYSGKTRNAIIDSFKRTPYKSAWTATPAPNDYMELGNHAEFLDVMTRAEMLSMYFVHDGGETQSWRLKGHAEKAFWEWVSSWSMAYSKPSDLDPSFSDEGFNLPKLSIKSHVVDIPCDKAGMLFAMPVENLGAQRMVKRISIDKRIEKAAEIGSAADYCVYWCDLNDEGVALKKTIPGAVELHGSLSLDAKEEILWAFSKGEIKQLITKQKITSFGLNWQHCNQTVFVGPNYSYEGAYQAICRFYRFGQKRDVAAHWVLADLEFNVFNALLSKFKAHDEMREALKCVA